MYKAFFNLVRNPFDLSPDPRCFVPTKRHDEALAALYYGIRRHKGFVVLTGEVGTGKTLLLRCLLELLKESKDVAYSYVFNGRLSSTEFLQYILADFEIQTSGSSKSDLLHNLGKFLISRGSKRMTTVLIVDEAHLLSADILEEIRLLSNLETNDDKLLQIVLVGQPELNDKLDSMDLRQLKQRIAVRTHLDSLNAVEVKQYIKMRLQIAGRNLDSDSLFPEQAITAIYRHSRGLPRLINTICDNAFITAYAKRSSSITPDIIEEVASEFRLDVVYPQSERTGSFSETDTQRATHLLHKLYEELQKRIANDSNFDVPIAAEMSKHEPYI